MPFGQLVVGPPGSGKTTFCLGMFQFLEAMKRKPVVVNLDFANDQLPYECAIDVSEFLDISKVMEENHLGPNGALIYCMEELEKKFEWLEERLKALDPESYVLFDCPGQVELFICNQSFQKIVQRISRLHFRLATVHLIDSFHIQDPAKFVSVLILSLQSMLQLEYPHINVLTKIDNIRSYGTLPFELEQYSDPSDLSFLMNVLDLSAFGKRHRKLSDALCELIEDFGMITFVPFAIEDKECLAYLLQEIDKANGHVFGGLTSGNESIMDVCMSSVGSDEYISVMNARYVIPEEITENLEK